jgi:RHS repeat-associated protein
MSCSGFRPDELRRLVGDPVDVVTGANVLRLDDFVLPGPVPLAWRRYYDSRRHNDHLALGWGHTHEHDRALHFDVDGVRYVGPGGEEVGFPALTRDGDEAAAGGLTLRRVSAREFQVAAADEPVMEFAFADPGRPAPLRRWRRGSSTVELHYTPEGSLRELVDSRGRLVRVATDPEGRVLRLTLLAVSKQDKDRVLVAYQYDRAGNLIAGTDAYQHRFTHEFDEDRRLTRRTDRRGFSFHFEYDRQGRCVRTRGDDDLLDTRLRYLPEQRATVVTRADGGEWLYVYDDAGTVTQIVDPYGGVQRFKTDESGRVVEEIDPNQNVTRVVYDADGSPLAKQSPLGQVTPITGSLGLRNPEDPNVPTRPLGWEYGDWLAAETIRLPESGAAVLQQVHRFARGQVRTTDPPQPGRNGDGAGPVYDELGLLLRDVGPDGKGRSWSYDVNGRVARYHDRDGAAHRVEYTSYNHPHRATDPVGNTVTFQFSQTEQLAAVVDAGGTRTEFVRDRKDRIVRIVRHGAVKEEYAYDRADNLIKKSDGRGACLLTHEIGPGNLVTVRRLASGEAHRFTYDERGRLKHVEVPDAALDFGYDDWGNWVRDERNGRGVRLEFDGTIPVAVTVLGRFRTEYQRPTRKTILLRDPTGREHKVRHLGNGLVVRAMSNGTREVSQYDADGRCLVKVASRTRHPARPWSRVYHYSGEGDLVRVEDSWRGTAEYSYDAAHRLTGGRVPDREPFAFAYDAAGNLLQQPGLEGVSLRDGNRLEFANGDTFEYNPRNHVAARRGPAGETHFHYNELDQLTACANGAGPWQAHYDPLGRRTRKSWGGRRVEYYWYRDRLEAEVGRDGRVRVYVYPDAFALVPLVFVEYASAEADPASGDVYYLFGDQVGAPLLVEDEAGATAWSATLEPYGRARVDSASRIDLPLRFPGHYHDAETGLHYNRHRYYSPELGRYLQSDPVGLAGGFNLYAYPANPLNRVDVQGLMCDPDDEPTNPGRGPAKTQKIVIESDQCYGPHQLGYVPGKVLGSIFNQYAAKKPIPVAGYKMHISVQPHQADIVARVVLHKLREMDVHHKVVSDISALRNMGEQQGKFITIYAADAKEAAAIVKAIDPTLATLRDKGLVEPGPSSLVRPKHDPGLTIPIAQQKEELKKARERGEITRGELKQKERELDEQLQQQLSPEDKQRVADFEQQSKELSKLDKELQDKIDNASADADTIDTSPRDKLANDLRSQMEPETPVGESGLITTIFTNFKD